MATKYEAALSRKRTETTYRSAVSKLERYGFARNRAMDPECRTVNITDDEAVAILQMIDDLGGFNKEG